MSETKTKIVVFTNGVQEPGEHKPIKKIKLHQTMSKAEIDALVEETRKKQEEDR